MQKRIVYLITTLLCFSVWVFGSLSASAQCTTNLYDDGFGPEGCAFGDGFERFQISGNLTAASVLLNNDQGAGNGCAAAVNGFSDFTGLAAPNLIAGQSYMATFRSNFDDQNVALWIDFNDNNIFEAGELLLLLQNPGGPTGVIAGNDFFLEGGFSIPCNAPLGMHRLRIRAVWNNGGVWGPGLGGPADDPCATQPYGEVEDYMINIISPITIAITNETTCPGNDGIADVTILNQEPCKTSSVLGCPAGAVSETNTVGTVQGAFQNNATPYRINGGVTDARIFYLYTAADLTAAGVDPGKITSIGFSTAAIPGVTTFNDYTIRMACVADQDLTIPTLNTALTTLQVVKFPAAFSPVLGLNTHTLDLPYVWDGTSSLVVEICFNNTVVQAGALTVDVDFPLYNSAFHCTSITATDNGCALLSGNFFTVRPVTVFNMCKNSFNWSDIGVVTNPDRNNLSAAGSPYTFTLNDFNGCTFSSIVNIGAPNPPPPPTFTGNTQLCPTDNLTLTADNYPNATSYVWTGPFVGSPFTGQTLNVANPVPFGTYSLTVNVTGCPPNTVPFTVSASLLPTPTSTFNVPPPVVCTQTPQTVTYTGSGGASDIYNWNFGVDATPQTANTQGPHNIVWSTPGTKTISLQVTSAAMPAFSGTNSPNLPIPENFACNFPGNGISVPIAVPGGRPPLTAAEVAGMLVTVNIAGDPNNFIGDLHLFLQAPNGMVLPLSLANGGGPGGSYTNTVFSDAGLTPIFAGTPDFTGTFTPQGGPFAGCTVAGTLVNNFAAFAGMDPTGTWNLIVVDNFIDGFPSTFSNWSLFLPPVPGCTSPITENTVTVQETPSNAFAFDGLVCVGDPATFTATASGGGVTYNWNFASGTPATSTVQAPSVTWNTAGTFNASLTTSQNGCTSPANVVPVVVRDKPTMGTPLSATPATVCVNETVTINGTATDPTDTYLWDFAGATFTPGTADGPHTGSFATPGTYDVSLTLTDLVPGQTFTNTNNVDVPSDQGCLGGVGAGSSLVVSGLPTSSITQAQAAQISVNFTIPSIAPDNGLTSALTVLLIAPDGSVLILSQGNTAADNSDFSNVTFQDGASDVTIAPTFNGGSFAPQGGGTVCDPFIFNPQRFSFEEWGLFGLDPNGTWQLVVFDNLDVGFVVHTIDQWSITFPDMPGCSQTFTTQVVVNDFPVAPAISSNSPVCTGGTLNLTAPTIAGATYAWTGPNGFSSNLEDPTRGPLTAADAGDYSLVVTVGGCTSPMSTTTVVVNPTPNATPVVSNSPLCAGATLLLDGPTVAGATYNWTGPNSFTSNVEDPTRGPVVLADAGVYSLTVTVGGCTSPVATTNVVINPSPAAPSATTTALPLGCGQTLTITPSGGTPPYDIARSDNGFLASGPGPFVDPSPVDGTTYTLTYTVAGCTSAPFTVGPITVSGAPAPPTANSNSPICEGGTINLTASNVAGATYAWTGPALFSSALQNPTIPAATAANAGTYSVTVTVAGCTSTPATTVVTVNPVPTTTFTPPAPPVCTGQNATFTYTGSGVAADTYTWNFDGATVISSTHPNYVVSWPTPGTKNVTLQVTQTLQPGFTQTNSTSGAIPDGQCALGTGVTRSINVAGRPPVLSAAEAALITVTVNITHTFTGDVLMYLRAPNGTILPLSTNNGGGGDNFTNTVFFDGAGVNITAGAAPFTGTFRPEGGALGCTLTGTTVGTFAGFSGINPNGNWDLIIFDDFLTDTGTLVNWTLTLPPVPGCSATSPVTPITVNSTPVNTFTSSSPICEGNPTTFTANAGGTATYAWTFASGTPASSTVQAPSVTWATAGTFAVGLTVTDNGCASATNTQNITVQPAPSLTIDAPSPVCEGATHTINLVGADANDLFVINFDGGTHTGTGTGPFTGTFATAGTKTITVTATDLQPQTFTFNPATPVAIPDNDCVTGVTAPIAVAGAVNPLTAADAAAITVQLNMTHTFTGDLDFYLVAPDGSILPLSTDNGAGGDNFTNTVFFDGAGTNITAGVAPFTGTFRPEGGALSCGSLSGTLRNTFGGFAGINPNGNWTLRVFDDAGSDVGALVNWSITLPRVQQCSRVFTANVTVNPVPAAPAPLSSNTPLCTGQTLNLSAPTIAGATYNWTGPNTFTSNLEDPTRPSVTLADAGDYSLTVTVGGCTSPQSTTNVVVNATPTTPTVSSNSPVCEGQTINLNGPTVAGATYAWTGPNTFISNLEDPSIPLAPIQADGIYSLTVTVNGCTSPVGTTTVVVVPVSGAPVLTSNSPVCEGGTINLNAPTVAGATYAWTGPAAFVSNLEDPTIVGATVANAGVYSLIITASGCTTPMGTVTVVVNPTPAAPAPLSSNTPVCAGSTLNLTAPFIAGATYNWSGPNSFLSAVQNPSIAGITAAGQGDYSLTVTVAGCTSPQSTTNVVVNPIPATPTVSSNSPVCEGATLNLTGPTVAGATYSWTGPGAFTANTQNATRAAITVAQAGGYSLTVTVGGCASLPGVTNVVVNPIPPAPTATFTTLPLNCGQAFTITPSGGSNFVVTRSDAGFTAGPGTGPFTDPTPVAGTTYNVTSTVAGCTSLPFTTPVITAAVAPPAPSPLASNSPICVGGTLNLTGPVVAGATYNWTGPNSFSANTQNATRIGVTTLDAGLYSLTVTVAGCTSFPSTISVVVNPIPAAPAPLGSNSPVCQGTTLNLTGPAIAGATYNWTGPNFYNQVGQNVSRASMTLADAGLYSLSVTVGGCTSPISTVNVVVNTAPPAPSATTTALPLPCGSSFTITPSGGTAPYTVTRNDGLFTQTGAGPFTDPNPIGGTTYSLVAIGGACPSLPFTIGPITTAGTPPAPSPLGNNGPICAGQTLQLTAPTIAGATYNWTGPGAFVSNSQNPTIINAQVANSGTYSLSVVVAGCASPISTTTAVVNALPAAPTVFTNSPICSGQNMVITVSGDPGTPDYTITRSDGGFTATGAGPTFTDTNPLTGTTYSVTYTHNGCTSSIGTSATVTVKPTPVITAGSNSPVCSGNSINLTATFVTGATYAWTGPLAFTSNQPNPVIANANTNMSSSYTVVATLDGCPSNPVSTTVTVNQTPSATATNNGPLCAGQTLNLQATAVTGATYTWSGPNGYVSNIQNPTIPFAPVTAAGNYNVIITSAQGCASPVSTTTVVINSIPFAPATIPFMNVCQGQNISLTASLIAGATYSWTGPGAFNSIQQNPVIPGATILNSGTYSVTATVNGCTSPAGTTVVNVTPTPNPGFADNSGPYCESDVIELFTGNVTGATYSWTGPAGFISGDQNPVIFNATTNNQGVYSVTASLNGCTSPVFTTTVVVNQPVTAIFASNNGPVCAGQDVTLTATFVPNATYLWTGPASFGSTQQNPIIVNTTSLNNGVYSVMVTQNCGAPVILTTNVVINETPAPTATSNSPVCVGQTLNLFASPIPGATYSWVGPLGFNSTLQNPSIPNVTALASGTYTVTATANGCPSVSSTVNVIVQTGLGTVVAGNNGPICTGQTLQLTATNIPGASYMWMGPNGFVEVTQNPSISNVSALNAGIYTVTVSLGSCASSPATTTVVVNSTPSSLASSNSPVCQNGTINLFAQPVTGASYLWAGPSSFSSTLQNPTIPGAQLTNGGTYTLTVTANGCTSLPVITNVNVVTAPSAPVANNNGPLCAGQPLVLLASTVPGASYNWSGPNGFISTLQNPTFINVSALNQGVYTVTASIGGCTSAPATTNVIVNSIPATPTISSNSPVCAGQALSLTANAIVGATYMWTGPNGFNSTAQSPAIPNVSTFASGTYNLIVMVNGCGSAPATMNVTVNPIPMMPLVSSNSPLCVGQTLNLFASSPAPVTFQWTGPNAFTSTLANPSIANATALASGTYSVTASANGCASAPATIAVTVNPVPATPTVGNNSPVCTGGSLNLTASLIPGALYSWTGPGAFTSSTQNPTINNVSLANAGVYSLMVTLNGCSAATMATTTVTVNATPLAPAASSNSPVCSGNTLNLTASTVPGATYAWTGPNGFSSAAQNPSIPTAGPTNGGLYSVTVTVNGCTSTPATTNVIINVTPSAPAVSSNSPICIGSALQLTASPIPGAFYSWTGPNGFVANQQNPSLAFPTTANSGVYSLVATVAGCSAPVVTTTVVVNPRPSAVVSGPNNLSFCAGAPMSFPVVFNGKGPWVLNYTANNVPQNVTVGNAGSPSPSTFIISVTPTVTTTYVLQSVTDGNNCTTPGGGSVIINVLPLPTAQIVSPNASICEGQSTTYNVQVTGKGPWSISSSANGFPLAPIVVGGSASPSPSVFTITVTPAATTTYTLTSVSDPNGCVGTASGTFVATVNPKPTLTVTTPNLVTCSGQTTNIGVTLTGQGPWTIQYSQLGGPLQTLILGNAGSPSPSNFTIPVTPTGNAQYSFVSVVSGTGCSNTATGTVTVSVQPKPTVSFANGGFSICGSTGVNVNFALTGTGPWTINYTANGVPQPTVVAGNGASPSPFTFTLPVTPTVTTTYAITNVTDGNGCTNTSTSTLVVKVDVAPTATISTITQEICLGQPASVTIEVTGRGPWVVNYTRNNVAQTFTLGNSASPSPSSFTIPFSLVTTTTFTLTSVTGGNGCPGTVTGSAVITVNPRPTAVFANSSLSICEGQTAQLPVNLSGKGPWTVSYLINGIAQTPLTLGNSASPSPTLINVPVSPTTTTTYSITNVLDGNGCTNISGSQIIVKVNPNPVASFATGTELQVCKGSTVNLTVNVVGVGPWTVNYLENTTPRSTTFGTTASPSPTTFVITAAPTVATTYTLTGVVSGNGCTGTASGSVAVILNDVPNAAFANSNTLNVCTGVAPVINVNITEIPSGDNWTLTYLEGSTTKTISGSGNGTVALTTGVLASTTTFTLTNITNTTANPNCPRTLNATLTVSVVSRPQLCIVTHTDVATPGGLGDIQATASGGTGIGYSYSLDGINFGNTSGFFPGLTPGIYSVFVRDANLCEAISLPVVIHDFVAPTVYLKTYQAEGSEEGTTVIQTTDGGYLAAGYTNSVGVGGEEAALKKYDSEGVLQWSRAFGGSADERANSAIETADGGYVFAGSTTTFGAGSSDFYVVKTDANGNMVWSHTVGQGAEDIGRSVVQAPDGGYIVAGTTRNPLSPLDRDVMLAKFDVLGNLQWTKTYGNPSSLEDVWQVKQACDGGYVMVGSTRGVGPSFDTYVIKVDEMGNEKWSRAYVSSANEVGQSVDNTPDGGYIVAGTLTSGATADIFVMKLDAAGTRQWSNRYGTPDKDEARMIVRTQDGNYAVAGFTERTISTRYSYLLKISQNGNSVMWAKSYNNLEYNQFWGLTQSTDGGYAAYGLAQQAGANNNYFFAKTDAMGNTNDCRQRDVPTTRTILAMSTSVLGAPYAQGNPTLPALNPLDQITDLNLTEVNICGPKPTAMIMGNPPTICPGQTATLSIALTGTAPWSIGLVENGGPAQTFTNIMASPFTVTVTPSGIGVTTYTLAGVMDLNYSAGIVSGTGLVTVNPPSTASAVLSGDPAAVCLGQSEVLMVELTGTAPWTIGVSENGDAPIIISGITSSPYMLTVTPSQVGVSTYTLVSVTPSSACFTEGVVSGEVSINVTPFTNSTAEISGSPAAVCLGQPVTFTVTLTGVAPWSIRYSENGAPGIAVSPITSSPYTLTVTPTGSGVRTYTLTEVFDVNACASGVVSGSAIVTVNTGNSATATISGTAPSICLGQPAVFTVNLTGTSPWTLQYSENGGVPVTVSGITATPFQLTVTPTGVGTRTYTLVNVAGSNGCFGGATSGQGIVPVQTNSLATGVLSGSTTVCSSGAAPASVPLTVTLTGTAPWTIQYQLNSNSPITVSGITASPFTFNVTPVGTGSFTYSLVSVTDASSCPGGVASGVAVVNVIPRSTAVIGGVASVCPGQTATINVSLTGTAPWTIQYSQNGGAPITVNNISSSFFTLTVTPANIGFNSFTLVSVSDANTACGSGNVSGSAQVNVQANTTATLSGGGQTICQGQTAQLTLTLTGTAPWTVTYLQNGTNPVTVANITGSPFIITVTPTGIGTTTFSLQSVVGAESSCPGSSVSGSALVTVAQTPVLTVTSKQDIACNGSTGSVSVSATGGSGITYSTGVGASTITNGTGIFNGLPAGTYVITATNSAGCSASVTVQINQPATPTITSITGLTSSSATVNWTAIGGASSYIVSIRVVGAANFVDRPAVTTPFITLSGLQANTNYEVRVRAVCPNGTQSSNSNTQAFTTLVNTAQGSCGIPGGIFANINGTAGTINWTPNASGAVCYIVSYGPTSTNPNLWPQFLVPHPGNILTISGLIANTEYGVRIRTNCTLCSVNTGVRSSFSPTITFSTGTAKEDASASITEDVARLAQFNVYPNPNKGIFTVSFDAAEASSVNVTITDMTGKKVVMNNYDIVTGHNELPIDLTQHAAGVYLLQMNDGQSVRTVKVVVN